MMKRTVLAAGVAMALTALIATGAGAHPGHGIEPAAPDGHTHPFAGLEYILALIGIGLALGVFGRRRALKRVHGALARWRAR